MYPLPQSARKFTAREKADACRSANGQIDNWQSCTFLHFFDFGSKISKKFYLNFWKFLIFGAREGLVLTVREERIQKFVDTGEKWVFEICTFLELLFLRKTIETLVKPNFSKSRIQVQVRFFTVTARKTEGDVQVWKETEQIRRRNVDQVQSLFSFFFLKGKESIGRIASSCCWRPRRAIFFGCWKRAVLARFERYWRSTVYISSSCERQYFQNCRIRWYSGERIKTRLFIVKMHVFCDFYVFY